MTQRKFDPLCAAVAKELERVSRHIRMWDTAIFCIIALMQATLTAINQLHETLDPSLYKVFTATLGILIIVLHAFAKVTQLEGSGKTLSSVQGLLSAHKAANKPAHDIPQRWLREMAEVRTLGYANPLRKMWDCSADSEHVEPEQQPTAGPSNPLSSML